MVFILKQFRHTCSIYIKILKDRVLRRVSVWTLSRDHTLEYVESDFEYFCSVVIDASFDPLPLTDPDYLSVFSCCLQEEWHSVTAGTSRVCLTPLWPLTPATPPYSISHSALPHPHKICLSHISLAQKVYF